MVVVSVTTLMTKSSVHTVSNTTCPLMCFAQHVLCHKMSSLLLEGVPFAEAASTCGCVLAHAA